MISKISSQSFNEIIMWCMDNYGVGEHTNNVFIELNSLYPIWGNINGIN